MKSSVVVLAFVVLSSSTLFSQSIFIAVVTDSVNGEPVIGGNVSVSGTHLGGITDTKGNVTIPDVPNGSQTILFSSVGYRSLRLVIAFPLPSSNKTIHVKMIQTEVEVSGVTVTTTRTSYHLDDAPVRIEVKGEEDIGETMIDHPSSISELFLESTGIQVLQTSAVSNYVSIKLQGLDGSYTQILKDGFPLYGGLSAGLSVTQIPPLDLNRVEVIKGPSSSLYGGGAIAGIINLISKKPDKRGLLTVLVNGASSHGIDAGALYSKQGDGIGVTVLVNGSSSAAYDGDHNGFSDIPKEQLFTVNPKIFCDLSDNTNITFGVSTTSDRLSGGDMTALKDGPTTLHPYLETTKSNRTYTQLELNSSSGEASISLKNSIGYFFLSSSLGTDRFEGTQWTGYTELSVQMRTGEQTITGGLNLITDRFSENPSSSGMNRSYNQSTAGVFAQDDWRLAVPFTLESGLRVDGANRFGVHILPRIAGLYRISNEIGVRASVGTGYKIPTIFSAQSSSEVFYRLSPIRPDLDVENSVGGEFDVSYNTIALGAVSLIVDQALFYTRVNDPIVVTPNVSSMTGGISLANGKGYVFSRGAETDIKLSSGDLQAFIGYTYVDAERRFSDSHGELFLTPPHKFVMDVLADVEQVGEVGAELRYTGRQLLQDGTKSPSFWVVDLLFQKTLSRFTFFVGIENLFDFQEAQFTPVVLGGSLNPQFNDVWAPIEGRVFNAGLKFTM